MSEEGRRNWDSVCGDCERFAAGHCEVSGKEAQALDSFAAICEYFATDRAGRAESEAATQAG